MKENDLRELPIEYLWEGLVLKDNIYDYTGATLLIPRGEKLTGEKLKRLYNFKFLYKKEMGVRSKARLNFHIPIIK